MSLRYHKNFIKNFKKRISPDKKLVRRFKNRLEQLVTNPTDPQLKSHLLTGNKKNYRSISITGDIRLIYRKQGSTVELYDIGSHNQVY